jgi:hypothetical protein
MEAVYPAPTSWKPCPQLVAQSNALAANCRGLFYFQKSDGSYTTYAGTATKLYEYNSTDTTWSDVTRAVGGNYNLTSEDLWDATQFGDFAVFTNVNDAPQVVNVNTGLGTKFADLGGSPPQAKYCTVMDNVLVLANLSTDETSIQWSDNNDSTEWSAGVADSQAFPDAGAVQGVFPHARLILQQNGQRQIILTGDSAKFEFPELAETKGTVVPYGSVELGGICVWLATDGFYIGNANEQRAISNYRVSSYFFNTYNSSDAWRINATHDPFASRILIAYPDASTDYNTRVLVYDWALDKWSELVVNTFFISRMAAPGVTLEGLDSISASLDALSASLDSRLWKGGEPALAAVDEDGKMAYFEGTPMAAQFRTGKHALVPGWRSRVRWVTPLVDGGDGTSTIKIGRRGSLSASSSQTSSISLQTSGRCPASADARYHDFQLDIPAGVQWNDVVGLSPIDFVRTTQR